MAKKEKPSMNPSTKPSAPPPPAVTAPAPVADVPVAPPVVLRSPEAPPFGVEQPLSTLAADFEKLREEGTRQRREAIAKVVHELNRVLTAHAGDVPVQPPWEECSKEMQESAIAGVLLFERNPGVSPEQMHEEWCKYKEAQGWSYNGIYDAEAKRHPNLRPYGALAPEVRLKDKVFHAVVGTLLKL